MNLINGALSEVRKWKGFVWNVKHQHATSVMMSFFVLFLVFVMAPALPVARYTT